MREYGDSLENSKNRIAFLKHILAKGTEAADVSRMHDYIMRNVDVWENESEYSFFNLIHQDRSNTTNINTKKRKLETVHKAMKEGGGRLVYSKIMKQKNFKTLDTITLNKNVELKTTKTDFEFFFEKSNNKKTKKLFQNITKINQYINNNKDLKNSRDLNSNGNIIDESVLYSLNEKILKKLKIRNKKLKEFMDSHTYFNDNDFVNIVSYSSSWNNNKKTKEYNYTERKLNSEIENISFLERKLNVITKIPDKNNIKRWSDGSVKDKITNEIGKLSYSAKFEFIKKLYQMYYISDRLSNKKLDEIPLYLPKRDDTIKLIKELKVVPGNLTSSVSGLSLLNGVRPTPISTYFIHYIFKSSSTSIDIDRGNIILENLESISKNIPKIMRIKDDIRTIDGKEIDTYTLPNIAKDLMKYIQVDKLKDITLTTSVEDVFFESFINSENLEKIEKTLDEHLEIYKQLEDQKRILDKKNVIYGRFTLKENYNLNIDDGGVGIIAPPIDDLFKNQLKSQIEKIKNNTSLSTLEKYKELNKLFENGLED